VHQQDDRDVRIAERLPGHADVQDTAADRDCETGVER
jgi:hypothetical protein